jgi:hypothetical protein
MNGPDAATLSFVPFPSRSFRKGAESRAAVVGCVEVYCERRFITLSDLH